MCQNIDCFVMKITQTVDALRRRQFRRPVAAQDERVEAQVLRNVAYFAQLLRRRLVSAARRRRRSGGRRVMIVTMVVVIHFRGVAAAAHYAV